MARLPNEAALADSCSSSSLRYRAGLGIPDLRRIFGDGSIAELSGVGREVKAVIDFDDEAVGRKTIKLAYTTLERGQE